MVWYLHYKLPSQEANLGNAHLEQIRKLSGEAMGDFNYLDISWENNMAKIERFKISSDSADHFKFLKFKQKWISISDLIPTKRQR